MLAEALARGLERENTQLRQMLTESNEQVMQLARRMAALEESLLVRRGPATLRLHYFRTGEATRTLLAQRLPCANCGQQGHTSTTCPAPCRGCGQSEHRHLDTCPTRYAPF